MINFNVQRKLDYGSNVVIGCVITSNDDNDNDDKGYDDDNDGCFRSSIVK